MKVEETSGIRMYLQMF